MRWRSKPAWRRPSVLALVALALISLSAGALYAAPGDPAPSPQVDAPAASPAPSNDATRFVAPDGEDTGACTRAAPCRSFQQAYAMAGPGEVVEVAGGRYPRQQLFASGDRTGPNVVFRPRSGARVVLRGLSLGTSEAVDGPDRVTVRDMETAYARTGAARGNQIGVWVGPGSSHVTLERIDAGSVDSWFADHLTVKGGDYGPCRAVWDADNVCGNSKQDAARDLLIDGAAFHDYTFGDSCFEPGADCHWECMYVNAGVDVTIRNSVFRSCAVFDLFATISGPDAGRMGHRNLRIYNNWFAAPRAESSRYSAASRATAVSLAWCQNSPRGYRDVFVGFNSFQSHATLVIDNNPRCVFEDVRVVGNLLSYDGGCQPRWRFRFNVWSTAYKTGTCHATDVVHGPELPYRDGGGGPSMDYRLAGASAADGLVPVSAGCPSTDIDGRPRPRTGHCTAGAVER